MRERMKLKDIWDLAKVRAKDNLYTLILIEIIIIMISCSAGCTDAADFKTTADVCFLDR